MAGDYTTVLPRASIEDIENILKPQQSPEKFWMVWVSGATAPSKQHLTWTEACDEASRLSKNNVGRKVYVLVSLRHYETTLSIKLTDIPS